MSKLEKETSVLADINLALEALTDDLVPAILGDEGDFHITYDVKENELTFSWTWGSREMKNTQKLDYTYRNPTEFMRMVKTYFFDLCIMLANL